MKKIWADCPRCDSSGILFPNCPDPEDRICLRCYGIGSVEMMSGPFVYLNEKAEAVEMGRPFYDPMPVEEYAIRLEQLCRRQALERMIGRPP